MPGAYHVELVPSSKNEVRIYLLDLDWKNPSIKDSSAELKISSLPNTKLNCSPTKENYFTCPLPKDFNLDSKGEILVLSKRESQIGNEAKYELPLKIANARK